MMQSMLMHVQYCSMLQRKALTAYILVEDQFRPPLDILKVDQEQSSPQTAVLGVSYVLRYKLSTLVVF